MEKRTILIIDDDVAVLEILNEWLTDEGYDVKAFSEAGNIIKMLNTYRPDVVLLDYLLKGKCGGELSKEIKADPIFSMTPVVIFSACTPHSFGLDDYPCDAFIQKPFDLFELTEKLNYLISPEISPV